MNSSLTDKGSVAILGCGWLGTQLAQTLLKEGYAVFGSTTSEDKLESLSAMGIRPVVVELPLADGPDGESVELSADQKAFWAAQQLLINIPPGRSSTASRDYPVAVLSAVLQYRRSRPDGRILFCSSTGIYDELKGRVNEQSPIPGEDERVRMLAMAEYQVQVQSQRPWKIFRLAGLYGPGRHPGRYLAGRKHIADGDAPINLVSSERVIARLLHYLDQPFWTSGIENVVDPEHPSRRDYYTAFAKTHGLPLPEFESGGQGKLVESLYSDPYAVGS